jgi:hypothetical protein
MDFQRHQLEPPHMSFNAPRPVPAMNLVPPLGATAACHSWSPSMQRTEQKSKQLPRDGRSRMHVQAAKLQQRADALQILVGMTPHQRSLIHLILRRDDNFLIQQFEDAVTAAERAEPQRLQELLRMAEVLAAAEQTPGPEVQPDVTWVAVDYISDQISALEAAAVDCRARAVELRDARQFEQALFEMKQLKQLESQISELKTRLRDPG